MVRTLKFIVDRQIIRQDPACDFSDLIPGTEGYLKAEFSFSPEWKGCVKVADFQCYGIEYPPQILADGKTCKIPMEAAAMPYFQIGVLGKRKGFKITTNKILVVQDGGT